MNNPPATERTTEARPTSLEEIRDYPTIPVWSATGPSWAGLVGWRRGSAYAAARGGRIPVIRIGRRYLVPVPQLRRMLGDLDAA